MSRIGAMFAFDCHAYGPTCAKLLTGDPRMDLGPGAPHESARDCLRHLTPHSLASGHSIRDPNAVQCCLAGLWLLHDFLDESHQISQQIESPDGSYWHAIMHRREPDFGNSKYWLRRVGDHPVFADLFAGAKELGRRDSANDDPLPFLRNPPAWDPFRFVDCCELAVAGRTAELCRDIAQLEWWLLFDHCFRQATGSRG